MSELLPCAWSGTVADFLSLKPAEILSSLTHQLRELGSPQLFAWRNSIEDLAGTLKSCLPEAAECGLVLEYELPRSGGRRPDLIFLNNGIVLVIEFKNRVEPELSDIDQVLGYRRDLSDYHSGCREKKLIPVLVPLGFKGAPKIEQEVHIVSPKGLSSIIKDIASHHRNCPPNTKKWLQSNYEPLPALVEAARLLFERKPLPRIRSAEAVKIPERVARMETLINQSIKNGERLLILVTGVPGSGKTLIGLQTAYSKNLSGNAVMLSGNGPLVTVLQYVLDSKIFVQPLKNYLRDILVKRKEPPRENIVIFDEAQRAWDRDRVLAKHQGDLTDSEPSLLLSIARQIKGGFIVVGLIGEGQELHAGEESGIQNWVDAVSKESGWLVTGPKHYSKAFENVGISYNSEHLFNLSTSLRSRKAINLSDWVEHLLHGDLNKAKEIATDLTALGYPIRLSRGLEELKNYIRNRFNSSTIKRTGAIASSKFRKLGEYGITPAQHNFYYYGQWYEEDINHPKSSCRLETAISEFGCQGLELDLPLLCWGPDLRWNKSGWESHLGRARTVKNPHKLRLNAYRVLLTRGRDGLAIFVPPITELDDTARALVSAGIQQI